MTAHVDTVPWARVPKRDDDALRRAQDLWLPAARQRGIVTPDGACLTSAGLSRGRLRVAPTAGTDRSRLADPSGGIEFLTRSPDGSRLCAISTAGGEHRVIDETYPQADDEGDRRGLHDGRRVIGGTAGRRRLDGGIWLVATLLAVLVLSHYGEFGPPHHPPRPGPYYLLALVPSLACYSWALHSGFRTQRLDRTIAEDHPETLAAASDERRPEGV
ncbi:hypothetical protein [Streptomyces sp. NPDC057636]|uniref:hypothetical protein n=1 Tax=Streptomyces sp. NPDC057636 TaxID=3346189 RepID=UPI0036CE6D58